MPGQISEYKSGRYVPLFGLISSLTVNAPLCLRSTMDKDYKDLCNGCIRMMAPAMGRIKNRDNDLESSLLVDATNTFVVPFPWNQEVVKISPLKSMMLPRT